MADPSLAIAARAAFTAIRNDAPEDLFYFFALYTTEDGSYVCATAWSEEALARVVVTYRKRDARRSVDEHTRALRFSAPDSPFHETHSEGFARFQSGKALHDACFDALRELERDGFFGCGAARSKVIVNVVYGDMSDEQWLEHAERLNPRGAVERALPYLHLHRATGRVEAWGAHAYQVNGLSLSTNHTIAYSGSGGEVGVLDVATRRPIFERKRTGEHWACALSPDATRLYLGDRDAILILDPEKGAATSFAKTGKPATLAIAPDGSRLAASSFESPLRVFDTMSRQELWEDETIRKASIAFSPDGKWLAAATLRAENGKSIGSVACFDAATGRVRWSASLGPAYTSCVAWTPEGSDLLVATSQWVGRDEDRAAPAFSASSPPRRARHGAFSRGRIRSMRWRSHRPVGASR
ncbi:MAG: DUF4303 domain-containing protein [Myxococcales bacterium]|nr:DUF4303 domain-containing protein [Myxococcales bacterium]